MLETRYARHEFVQNRIRVTRPVWKGQEDDAWRTGKEFPTGRCYPPINGVPMWTGGVTENVKLLPPPEPPQQPADPTGGQPTNEGSKK